MRAEASVQSRVLQLASAKLWGDKDFARLDRIMTSRDLRVIECGVHTSPAARKASDHLPIWATLAPA